MAYAARGSDGDEDDALMGEDDIRAWNPSELDDDDYGDAEGSGSDRDGDRDDERESREDFYESREDEQPGPVSEQDGERVEEPNQELSVQEEEEDEQGDEEDDEPVESELDSPASSSEGARSDAGGRLEEPHSDGEADGDAEAAEEELSTSSWLNVELPLSNSSPPHDRFSSGSPASPAFAETSGDAGADVDDLGDHEEETTRALETTDPLPDEELTAPSSPLTSNSAAPINSSSGSASDASREPQVDTPQPVPPPASAPVHPLPLPRVASFPTPLSPSSSPHKRSNSLYITPTAVPTTLVKRTDSLESTSSASGSRTSQLRELDPSRRSSRLLDERKRKEIWHDFKRAEESVACPPVRESDPPSPVEVYATQVMSAAVRRGGSRRESSPPPRPTRDEEATRSKREEEGRRDSFVLGGWKMRREGSWSAGSSPTAPSRPKTLERRQTISAESPVRSAESPVKSSPRSLAGSLAAICSNGSTASSSDNNSVVAAAQVPAIAAAVPTTATSSPSVSMAEYERVIREKEALQAEVERSRRSALQDKEVAQSLSERENRYLKDESQKQLMQALGAKEAIRTLTDQLALRGKSEEQLKLQTKALLEQNQSLQADLLDKMATETDKIQKMARLSADKQALIQELGEKEAEASDRRDTERRKARRRLLLRLVKRKHRAALLSSMLRWKINAHGVGAACGKIASVLLGAVQRGEAQRKARALRLLMANSVREEHKTEVAELNKRLETALNAAKGERLSHTLSLLASVAELSRHRRLASAVRILQRHAMASRSRSQCTTLAASTLRLMVQTKARSSLQRAWTEWRVSAHSESESSRSARAQEAQDRLVEAKECVFSLSRAKTKLEEKLQAARDDGQVLANQLAEATADLRLAKHGYAVTVLRASERAWLRGFFSDWKEYTTVSLGSKQLRLQVQMAELRAAEREQHAKTLDEYARVLKSDLERFQFFSQDKRVAVDVLTKKLSRVEGRYREMEERHAVLEERGHSLKSQLAAFVEWEGASLPFAVLVLCKDVAVGNLRELFMLHAAAPVAGALVVPPAPSSSHSLSDQSSSNSAGHMTAGATAPRLPVDALVRLVESSSVVAVEKFVSREELPERLLRHLPSYAAERGLLFHDFLSGLNDFLGDVVAPGDRKYEQVKQFWASLLGLLTALRGASTHSTSGSNCTSNSGVRGGGDNNMLYTPRSSAWAGRLSDDILQNQEKLLAVLEHETAVVERAVMEKASLRHTYPPPADEQGEHATGAGSTFVEYQCEPVLPPDQSSVVSSPTSSLATGGLQLASNGSSMSSSALTPAAAAVLDKYTNWHLGAQIRDLFLACHRPLLKILMQYSDARRDPRHGDQFCLELAAVARMFEDMRLCPAFLSRDAVNRLFASSQSPADGLLPPQGFALFLGACALELYVTSLAAVSNPSTLTTPPTAATPQLPVPYLLSAREVLLSFFGDLGLLAESEVPPPARLAFVGMDVEAILWPLFEYYATGGDPHGRPDDERIGMTTATFAAFMGEIAGMRDQAPAIFRRAMLEAARTQRRSLDSKAQQDGGAMRTVPSGDASDAELDAMTMYLDDFYVAIGLVQAARVGPGVAFASAGDAVRQWMQQTQ